MNNYQLSSESPISIYYLIRCDDARRPNNLPCDIPFSLSEYDKVICLSDQLTAMDINHDLLIERFDSSKNEVLSNDYIVYKNYLNQ